MTHPALISDRKPALVSFRIYSGMQENSASAFGGHPVVNDIFARLYNRFHIKLNTST